MMTSTMPRETADDIYCRIITDQRCSVDEYLHHIEYAVRHGLSYRQPATADEYLAARLRYPDRVGRWTREALDRLGIAREGREVEERLSDDDADPLPYRMRRRIIATLREDAEWRAAVRELLIGGGRLMGAYDRDMPGRRPSTTGVRPQKIVDVSKVTPGMIRGDEEYPPDEPRNGYHSSGNGRSGNCENTENGFPKTELKPPVSFGMQTGPAFPVDCLPSWGADYVSQLSIATQTPPDLAGCMFLGAMAIACQKKFSVRPRSGWDEPVNLYLLGLMDPANRKSAVLSAMKVPLQEYERSESIRLAPSVRQARTKFEILTKQRNEFINSVTKAKDATEREHLLHQVTEIDEEIAANPVPDEPRLLIDDVTPEHLATKMMQNGGRIGAAVAEGDFFDILAGRYSKGTPNLGLVLKSHSGDDHRVDRGNRPSEYIKQPALSLVMLAQPEVFQGLLDQRSFRGRGLLGRLLYSKPESPLGNREIDPPDISPIVEKTYVDTMTAVLQLPAKQDDDGLYVAQRLFPTNDAVEVFRQFRVIIERDLSEFGRLASLTDWGGKIAGQTARIAGLLHISESVVDGSDIPPNISRQTMENAVKLGEYFIHHAIVVFSIMGADKSTSDAKHLLKVIQKNDLKVFTKRDLFQKVKGTFSKADDMDNPLKLLESHGYIADVTLPASGTVGRKPSPSFAVNPLIEIDSHNSQNSRNGDAA